MIDTHCHIDAAEFDADRDAVMARALAAGVTRLLVPAVSVPNFSAVRAACARYPQCLPALGLHPIYVHSDADVRHLAEAVCAAPVVAIGEIGLDGFDKRVDFARQQVLFDAQLQLARERDLPVLLHLRHAVEPGIAQLRRSGVRRGIAHAFNGSMQQAEQLIRMGFKLGFGGAMTYPRALNLRRLAAELPLESLVLETDAPDMPPVWTEDISGQGRRNLPEYLPRIAAEIATLRGMETAALVAACTANAHAVIGDHGR